MVAPCPFSNCRASPDTDGAFSDIGDPRRFARGVRHLGRRPGAEFTERHQVEDHGGRYNWNDAAADVESALSLFHPAHDAGRGIESIGGAASEEHGVDSTRLVRRGERLELASSCGSAENARGAPKRAVDAAQNRETGGAPRVSRVADGETYRGKVGAHSC